jgi:extracellular factor (EF) 3-hydroxypalmitic acid methyl ester biosynthesis protein
MLNHAFSLRDALGRLGKYAQANTKFDCVYSLGLFDYLSDRVASRLLAWFWSLLNPRGSLLIDNFHPDTMGRAWMEAVMDWWLTYRTEVQLRELGAGIPNEEIGQVQVHRDGSGVIVYLEMQKHLGA